MNKAQLCRHMVRHFDARALAVGGVRLRRKDAREFLEELERLCVRELADAGQFSIPKVAKLVVKTRRPRRGRDPSTGKTLEIPARRVVRARISRSVREAVEEPL